MQLLSLIESLREVLTGSDTSLQMDAFSKINDAARSLPRKYFTIKEVSHLVDFYVSRFVLYDPNLIKIVLEGIIWFADQELLDGDCAVKICRDGFFSSLHIPSLGNVERRLAYRLLFALLSFEPARSGLVKMKLSFIHGFITSVEGEKDPCCLMTVFSMHPLVLQHFELGSLAEKHFDCMAAYFPVDYAPPPEISAKISRRQLAEQLRLCLWAARHLDGGLLLPLLLEKSAAYQPEARDDALALLADCLVGVPHSASFLSKYSLVSLPPQDAININHVTAYLFAICNLVKQLATELDPSGDSGNVNQLLSIVAGLAMIYRNKLEENDFVETLLKCLWPKLPESETKNFDSSYAEDLDNVPRNLVADCLLTAVLSSPSGPIFASLFQRLVAPIVWPKIDPVDADDHFYEIKTREVIMWTPQALLLYRLFSNFSRVKNLSLQDLRMNEGEIGTLISNLLRTLKRSFGDLRLCHGSSHRIITELVSFGVLCRLFSVFSKDYKELEIAFLEFCPHVFGHLSSEEMETPLQEIILEQRCLLARLVSQVSLLQNDLQILLFKLIQDESPTELGNFAIDVLQRAACVNSTILSNLFTVLFQRCENSISLAPVVQMASALHSVTKSLRDDDVDKLILLASLLQSRSTAIMLVTGRVINKLFIKEAKTCLIDLLTSIRLIVSGLSEEHQIAVFSFFGSTTKTLEPSNLYVGALLNCAVISVLRPTLHDIPLNDIVSSLVNYFKIFISDRHCTNSALSNIAFNELCVCAATLINKFPDTEVLEGHKEILDLLLNDRKLGHSSVAFVPASRFIILTLRSLLVSQLNPSSARQQLLERLLKILLNTDFPRPDDGLQRACLLHSIHLLLPLLRPLNEDSLGSDDEIGSPTLKEEVFHCLVNPLALQKCFCIVGLRLRAAWQQLRVFVSPSSEEASLEEAFLHGYLRLVSLLPGNSIADYVSDALETAVLGVINNGRSEVGPLTLALSFLVISRLAALHPSTWFALLSSPATADSFLERLSHLRITPTSADSLVGVVRLRFNLACCLHLLTGLPIELKSRYYDDIRYLLEQLLDDDCQSVRLQAARAYHGWCRDASFQIET